MTKHHFTTGLRTPFSHRETLRHFIKQVSGSNNHIPSEVQVRLLALQPPHRPRPPAAKLAVLLLDSSIDVRASCTPPARFVRRPRASRLPSLHAQHPSAPFIPIVRRFRFHQTPFPFFDLSRRRELQGSSLLHLRLTWLTSFRLFLPATSSASHSPSTSARRSNRTRTHIVIVQGQF